jgi:hypothetical protein
MKRIFQTTFGVPTGNCFNAAVASVLELDSIPEIDPALQPDEAWRSAWCDFFDKIGVRWISVSWEPEYSNWRYHPPGLSIATVVILHAVVCLDGIPIHDVYPGSLFVALTDAMQRQLRIESWSYFGKLLEGELNDREALGCGPVQTSAVAEKPQESE